METAPAFPEADGDCAHGIGHVFFGMRQYHLLCKNADEYYTMLEGKLRKLFAKELGIEGLSQHLRHLLLGEEATVLIHDFKVIYADDLGEKRRGVARIASADEFGGSEELCRNRPAPLYYDAWRIRRDLRAVAKFVIVRRDRYVYAACLDGSELIEAVHSIPASLLIY